MDPNEVTILLFIRQAAMRTCHHHRSVPFRLRSLSLFSPNVRISCLNTRPPHHPPLSSSVFLVSFLVLFSPISVYPFFLFFFLTNTRRTTARPKHIPPPFPFLPSQSVMCIVANPILSTFLPRRFLVLSLVLSSTRWRRNGKRMMMRVDEVDSHS